VFLGSEVTLMFDSRDLEWRLLPRVSASRLWLGDKGVTYNNKLRRESVSMMKGYTSNYTITTTCLL
jgi:hypothetical protein